ncbi:MAG: N-methyl-L-tryptophan oxidase [Planctomycetota bacterium]|nr:N-methyl-L-tryptophan oxidase [Planctomycetota bacterium]
MESFDIIVVGVGAMGSSACYHLARRGVKVLGLEQHSIPHDLGSSHGQSRMIRCAYYEHPDYVPLLLRSWTLWEELQQEAGRDLLFATGGLYMGPAGCEFVEASRQAASEHGLAHESLDHAQLADRFPQFQLPENFIGMHETRAGFLVPEWCIEDHVRLAREHGADIREGEPVVDWSAGPNSVQVQTRSGTCEASHLVLSAGAWMPSLSRADLPLQVTRQVLGWMHPDDPRALALGSLPVWAIDTPGVGQLYGFPMAGDAGLPGPVGFKVAMHAAGEVDDPGTINREAGPGDEASFLEHVTNWIPAAGSRIETMRTCMYTNSSDEHFIIDAHPENERVTLATGFSGHGFKMSSVLGEILADLSTDGRTDHPVDFLRVR